ncbi:MAG: flavin-containing monooxygenase [Algiphilus sp.]
MKGANLFARLATSAHASQQVARPIADRNVCVVGAGPCGLATCKVLVQAGYDVEVFDASPAIGGLWSLDTPQSAVHPSLRANTSKQAMAYSDFPMPTSMDEFPDRAQVLEYLNAYVDHFHLRQFIKLNCKVERAQYIGDRWAIWLEGEQEHPRRYDSLVVCTGQFRTPVSPRLPGGDDFQGIQLHSRDYFSSNQPYSFDGTRVVVVGMGTSALDIAGELAEANTTQVDISVRSGRFLAPKMLGEHPLDSRSLHPSQALPVAANFVPRRFAVWASRRAIRNFWRDVHAYYGTPTDLGFPEPAYHPWEKPPTITDDIRPMLQKGKVRIRPGIERLNGENVLFSDGAEQKADVLIYGTGYRWAFPFLKDTLTAAGDDPEDGEAMALNHRIAHPRIDNLFFVGFCKQLCSILPLAEQQAYWLASRLAIEDAPRATKPTPMRQPLGTICNFYVDDLRRDMLRTSMR